MNYPVGYKFIVVND